MKPYKGITPLSGGSLAACAEAYFAQSEQLRLDLNSVLGSQRRRIVKSIGVQVES